MLIMVLITVEREFLNILRVKKFRFYAKQDNHPYPVTNHTTLDYHARSSFLLVQLNARLWCKIMELKIVKTNSDCPFNKISLVFSD